LKIQDIIKYYNIFIMDLEDEFILDDDIDFKKTVDEEEWLMKYLKEEELFNKFYKEKIKNIKLYFFYIDKHREIIKVFKNNLDISNNILQKGELINIVNKNRKILNKKFILTQILKYNFNIKNNDINKFLINNENFTFLKKINELDDIYWEDTIPLFQSLNSLYFIFFEKRKYNTKKIHLRRKKRAKTKKMYNKELKIKKTDIIKID